MFEFEFQLLEEGLSLPNGDTWRRMLSQTEQLDWSGQRKGTEGNTMFHDVELKCGCFGVEGACLMKENKEISLMRLLDKLRMGSVEAFWFSVVELVSFDGCENWILDWRVGCGGSCHSCVTVLPLSLSLPHTHTQTHTHTHSLPF